MQFVGKLIIFLIHRQNKSTDELVNFSLHFQLLQGDASILARPAGDVIEMADAFQDCPKVVELMNLQFLQRIRVFQARQHRIVKKYTQRETICVFLKQHRFFRVRNQRALGEYPGDYRVRNQKVLYVIARVDPVYVLKMILKLRQHQWRLRLRDCGMGMTPFCFNSSAARLLPVRNQTS